MNVGLLKKKMSKGLMDLPTDLIRYIFSIVCFEYYLDQYTAASVVLIDSIKMEQMIALITGDCRFRFSRMESCMSNRMSFLSLIHPRIRHILKDASDCHQTEPLWGFVESFFHSISRLGYYKRIGL